MLGGEYETASFSFIRTVTVGPGFTPGLLDPPNRGRRSRAFWQGQITAGGDFHPALRTSCERIKDFQALVN